MEFLSKIMLFSVSYILKLKYVDFYTDNRYRVLDISAIECVVGCLVPLFCFLKVPGFQENTGIVH